MKAWLFTGAHEPLQLIERDLPPPGEGEILLQVRAAGLCHSDVGCLDGTLTPHIPAPLPLILGHEAAGVVAEVGPGVIDYQVGDRVVASGTQAYCPGWTADGGYATQCLLPAACLIPLPDTVSFAQGAAATDAGQTAHGALIRIGQLQPGERVGIIGLGGLGMTAARIAVLNACQVYGAEPRREAWPAAIERGVIEVVESADELAPFELDLIVDYAGFGTTTAGAINAVKAGGRIVQVGLGKIEATIPTFTLVRKMASLRGSSGGTPADTSAVIAYMASGDLVMDVTSIGFDEIPQGLDRLQRGGVIGRIVAEMN